MKHHYLKKLAFVLAASATTLAGCQKEPVSPGTPGIPGAVNKIAPDGFNYSTTKTVKIDLRLLTNNNQPISGVPVNFFDPKKPAANESVYKLMSDKNGNVNGTLTIPGYLDTVLVKTNHIGLPLDVKIKVVNETLTATIGGSSGVSGNVVASAGRGEGTQKLSNSFTLLGKDDGPAFYFPSPYTLTPSLAIETGNGYTQKQGRPKYILPGRDVISASLLANINASLPEGEALGSTHPDYLLSSAVNTLKMTKESDVWVTFVHEGAGFKNTLAFYVYNTAKPPTKLSDIDFASFVFPNASTAPEGGLVSGDKVKLGRFGTGKSIGFVLLQNSWESSGSTYVVNPDKQKFYSHSGLNPERTLNKHSVMVYDPSHQLFLMGFEDLNREKPNTNGGQASDNDFNDLVVYITSNPVDGISTEGVPRVDISTDTDDDGVDDEQDEYPTDPTKAYNTYYPSREGWSTLAFEDNWPKTGDYDLNDLVVNSRYTLVKNAANDVVELAATYDVAAAGAANKNGFGVEFPFNPSLVSEVTGMKLTKNYVHLAANGLEADQQYAVIIPFDDHENVLKNADGTPQVNTIPGKEHATAELIEMKIKFGSPVASSQIGALASFNPFLIRNGIRGYEVHLPGYKPTSRGDKSFFGTEADNSSVADNRYYLARDNSPWALQFTEQFQYPVEFKNINSAYLHFGEWAASSGRNYQDWYSNTASGYRNTSNIYNK